MSHQEITLVFEFTFNRIGSPLLDGKATTLIMTIRTPGGRMTRPTNRRLPARGNSVPFQPSSIMPEEGLRYEAAQFLADMTRGTVATLEILLVTVETHGHRWRPHRSRLGIDDAAMADNALAVNLLLNEMTVVRK